MTTYSLHSGESLQLVATVKNVHGQKLSFSVVWHSSNPTSVTISQTGLATATGVAGSSNIFATVGNKSSAITTIINLGPATPTPVLSSYSVIPASTSPVAFATDLITIQALDQFGHNFNQSGVIVNFSILGGTGASLSASSGITNNVGLVTVTLTVGASQTYQIKAIDGVGRNGTSASIVAGAAQPIPPPPPPPPPPPDTTPASITLTNGNFTLNRGEIQPIVAVVKNAGGIVLATPVLVYHSATPANVTIDSSTGIVTGVGAGTSVITATLASPSLTSNALTLTCTGLPDNVPASITIPNPNFVGNEGDTVQFSAIIKNAEGIVLNGLISAWFVDSPLIASVGSTTGLVTLGSVVGVANMATSIGAIQSNGVTITNNGPVTPPPVPPPPPPVTPPPPQPPPPTQNVPASILITGPFLTFKINQSVQLTFAIENSGGQQLSGFAPDNWISDNTAVATVDLNGVVTAKSAGTANIIASYGTIKSTPFVITVAANPIDTTPASVSISPVSLSLQSGFQQVTATVKNAAGVILTGATVTWTSSSTSVATVTSPGLVTSVAFVSAGTSNIQAHASGIDSNICVCTCVAAPPTVGTTYLSADFSSGVYTDLFQSTPTPGITVKSDPTGHGHGNVVDIHYENNPAVGFIDDNLALIPATIPTIGLGEDLWFKGDCYIDAPIGFDISFYSKQRKLLYWGPYSLESGSPFGYSLVLDSFGPQFFINKYPNQGVKPGFNPGFPYPLYIDTAVVALAGQQWNTFQVHMRANSSFTAEDGIIQIWYNNLLFVDLHQISWTDPTDWSSHSTTEFGFTSFGIGYQVDSGGSGVQIIEERYWDNIKFGSTLQSIQ